jgi:hypothetical protein
VADDEPGQLANDDMKARRGTMKKLAMLSALCMVVTSFGSQAFAEDFSATIGMKGW